MATIYGTLGDDTLVGTGEDDYINGSEGNDILSGLGGNDWLVSGDGVDIVDGGAGDDLVVVDYSDNAVDILTGGTGADRFKFGIHQQSSVLTAMDRITDFSSADGDRLDIGVIDGSFGGRDLRWAGAITTPGFTLTAGQSLANSPADTTNVWTWTDGGSTWLIVDTNGTLDSDDFVIAFSGTPVLGIEAFVARTFMSLSGTLGNDNFTGSADPEIYFALEGDDTASGGGGDDQVNGGSGDDILAGGDGNDLLVGETGDDLLHGGGADDQLYAGSQGTSAESDAGTTNDLYGEDGDDVLVADEGRDLLDGGAGADILSSREDDTATGGDTLLGGDGDDALDFNGDLLVDGGAGDDRFYFGEIASIVTGGIGADRFDLIRTDSYGNFALGGFHLITDFNEAEGDRFNFGLPGHYQQPLIFRGALDNPVFSLQAGQSFSSSDYGSDLAQIWTWGSGDETFMIVDLDGSGDLGEADYVVRLGGSVILTAGAFEPDTLLTSPGGTAGADVIQGTDSYDVIYGLSGDDVIHAGAGNDYLYGNSGDDQISGGADSNYIYGGDGDDVLTGGHGVNRIHGGGGSDVIYGGDAGDELNAAGNHPGDIDTATDVNLIYGGDSRDLIRGGLGPLDQSFGNGGNDVINGGGLLDGGDGDDQLSSTTALESTTLDGGAGSDTLDSDATSDLMIGGAGDDTLRGRDGGDTLNGGDGDDFLSGGLGNDVINGGDGDDVLVVSGPASEYRLLMYGDDFILKGPDGGDHLTGVETVRFGDGRELELNRMYGRPGTDGAIPDHLLSPPAGDEPQVLPGLADKDANNDPFVLPAWLDDQPLILPGLEADKFADTSQPPPGLFEDAPPLEHTHAHLGPYGDWMLALDAEPAHRPIDWML